MAKDYREEFWKGLKELEEKLKETDEKIKELVKSQEETDKKMKELMESQKKTDYQIRSLTKAISELNGVWKNFSEKIVFDNIEDALKDLGFKVEYIIENIRKRIGSESIEIDILAGCENEVIVVGVKTTLKVEDVENFIEKLRDKFLTFFPEFKGRYKVYGAIAGLKLQEGVDKFAIKNGLLVLRYKDKGKVEVLNPRTFQLYNA